MNWKRLLIGIFLILIHVSLTVLTYYLIIYKANEMLKVIFIVLGSFYLIGEFIHTLLPRYPYNTFKTEETKKK